jgi:hypothetical protein
VSYKRLVRFTPKASGMLGETCHRSEDQSYDHTRMLKVPTNIPRAASLPRNRHHQSLNLVNCSFLRLTLAISPTTYLSSILLMSSMCPACSILLFGVEAEEPRSSSTRREGPLLIKTLEPKKNPAFLRI